MSLPRSESLHLHGERERLIDMFLHQDIFIPEILYKPDQSTPRTREVTWGTIACQEGIATKILRHVGITKEDIEKRVTTLKKAGDQRIETKSITPAYKTVDISTLSLQHESFLEELEKIDPENTEIMQYIISSRTVFDQWFKIAQRLFSKGEA